MSTPELSVSEEHEKISAPTTPGQAEGSENRDNQSQASPALAQLDPAQLDPAEGEAQSDA